MWTHEDGPVFRPAAIPSLSFHLTAKRVPPMPSVSFANQSVPSVIVVDPRFDAYGALATAAREGRIMLHLRASGRDALKLARRLAVDAWLVAEELDDMSGHDFVELLAGLQAGPNPGKVAMVGAVPNQDEPGRRLSELEARASGADAVLERPISLADLERLVVTPTAQRQAVLAASGIERGFVTLPVGVGAAVIAVAVLMLG
jgi:CheY-like chemotaxis protein